MRIVSPKSYWKGVGSTALVETSVNDQNPTRYIFFNGARIARIDPGAAAKYYVTDNVGSTQVETDSSGNLLNESLFFPYGVERIVQQNDTANNYRFSGKERDPQTGLDDFGARYYDSSLGRFVTPDWDAKPTAVPYASFGDPQTLNLYSYVENGPLNRVDADGHVSASGPGTTPPVCEDEHGGCQNVDWRGVEETNEGDFEATYVAMVDSSQKQAAASTGNSAAQQQNAVQTDGQKAASGPYGSNVISVSGNTTTLPLYNGPNSSAEIIGTQVVTDNLNSKGSGTIQIVNTNQSIEGSPTETITMRLKSGLIQSTSVRSSDGSVNMDSSTSFNSHTGQATVTMVNHNTSTVNVRVYDTAGGSGPVLRSNTTYDTTWAH